MTTILQITERFYPHMGGSTHRLLNILKGFDTNKFRIIVLSLKENGTDEQSKHENIIIYRFSKYREIPYLMYKIDLIHKPIDLIHTHNFRPSFFAYFGKFLLKSKPKVLTELHSIYKVGFIKDKISNFIVNTADRLLVLSNTSKEILKKKTIIPIEVIFNGIDLRKFAQISNKSNHEELSTFINDCRLKNKTLIGYAGSLDFFQGIDNLINFAKYLSGEEKFIFIIVGGEEHEWNNYKIPENVKTFPYIDSKYIPSFYQSIDCMIMLRPKILSTFTAIPLKPLEMLASGKIVISNKVGGMVELKTHINSDRLVLIDHEDDIIHLLKTLDFKNVSSKQYVQDELKAFDIASIQKQYFKLVDEIIS